MLLFPLLKVPSASPDMEPGGIVRELCPQVPYVIGNRSVRRRVMTPFDVRAPYPLTKLGICWPTVAKLGRLWPKLGRARPCLDPKSTDLGQNWPGIGQGKPEPSKVGPADVGPSSTNVASKPMMWGLEFMNVNQHVPRINQSWPEFGFRLPYFGQHWREAKVLRPNLAAHRPKLGRHRSPDSTEAGPTSKVDSTATKSSPTSTNFDQKLPDIDQ